VRLNDITTILRRGSILEEIVRTIENLNTNSTTRILGNNSLIQEVTIEERLSKPGTL